MKFFKQTIPDDASLISGSISNDRRSQEKLYRKYFNRLFTMGLRYTSDEDLVQEITHDAFLKAFKNLEKYQFAGSFEGWLRKIMFHCVVDHFRAKKSPRFIELDDIRQLFDESAALPWETEELIGHINALPDNHKTVFNLFAIEGYSHQEIAEKMGISEGTSKWYLNQARTILKGKIAQKKMNETYAK